MASLQVAMFSGIMPGKSGGVAGEGRPSSVRCCWRVPTRASVSRRWRRRRSFAVSCEVQDGDAQSDKNGGEEAPESLFMKELKRRGMTPSSLLEDAKRDNYGSTDGLEEDRAVSRRNAVSTEVDSSLSKQRERSMALNSEGLEGLIPRAKLLLSIGGTFFLGFGPLILIIVAFFSALYLNAEFLSGHFLLATAAHDAVTAIQEFLLYFGSSFVHDASDVQTSMPQYVDPYELLEDERISQIASSVN